MLAAWKKNYDQPRWHIKKQRHYFANKGLSSQSYAFSSSHVWLLELDCIESWVPKNWCIWTVVLEKILESPLVSKEIKPVNPKGKQSWIFIGRTDAEDEAPTLWPPDAKNWRLRRLWCWERLKAGEEGDEEVEMRMASSTRWTWIWANSRSLWWSRKSGMLQSMGLPRAGQDSANELRLTSYQIPPGSLVAVFSLDRDVELDHNHRFNCGKAWL